MWIDDQILAQYKNQLFFGVWTPEETLVVCGAGEDPSREVRLDQCENDRVIVLKRYGGGGTVVLYPGVVVVSIGTWVKRHFENSLYFRMINSAVIACLAKKWKKLATLETKGISDIAFGDLKVGGTSLFRTRNYLLYQASLIVDCDFELIEKLLAHPSREPDYRRGRSHSEFVTGLADIGECRPSEVEAQLMLHLESELREELKEELFEPLEEQFGAIIQRLERSLK